MSITIPAWLLWVLALAVGAPALLAIIILAWFGWVALTCFGRKP